ncbi:cytochrome P450 [Armillaria gallica]|uniref:Cytochrome P450 n=1 Tax=Armillaria gallica TaxID=47427 RepID=A0A2H3CL89_ARMGA|nr:cytochrome P450 [Armillaria gallica]
MIPTNRKSTATTKLRGPLSQSRLFGLHRVIHDAGYSGLLYEQWASEYGSVFSLPGFLGLEKLVLCDPKAVAHLYANEGFGYVKTMFGRSMLWAEGELHRRQRKFLTPAFSSATIRDLTHIFYDSAHRMASAWDAILEADDGTSTIDVQNWCVVVPTNDNNQLMNRISMDSIGIAKFSHDFGAIEGKPQIFDRVDLSGGAAFFAFMIVAGSMFPAVLRLPSKRKEALVDMNRVLSGVADQLLSKAKEHGNEEDTSIMGLLLQSETHDADVHMSRDEIIAQQLNSSLPYLDAVVHETLRMHPPVSEATRVATQDDVLPLSTPVVTKSGETVNSIFVAKGSILTVTLETLDTSEEFWGPNAKEFKPERWLEDFAPRAKEIQGHRHLLTFVDGPRTCLGKTFALAEFKAALFVIVQNFTFELPGGKETVIRKHHGNFLPRPQIVGEDGAKVPLRVRRVV